MSGRIRSVKPEWLDDERIALASSDARVLSIALMLLADDHGNGRASEVLLSARVFPGQPRETLAKALEELRALEFVVLYELDGQHYFEIRNWSKHQKIDHPSKGKVPARTDTCKVLANPREALSSPRDDDRESRASRDPLPSLPEGVQGETSPERLDGIRDDGSETPCPLDLADKWTGADAMAEALKVPRDAVDAVVAEFVAYWTVGAGTGKRRSHWARKLREEVRLKLRDGAPERKPSRVTGLEDTERW